MSYKKIDESKITAIADALRDVNGIPETDKQNHKYSLLTAPQAISNFKSPSKQWCVANANNTSTLKSETLSTSDWMIKGCIHVGANDPYYVVYPDGTTSEEMLQSTECDVEIVIKGSGKWINGSSNRFRVVFTSADSKGYIKHSFVPTRLKQHVDYYDKSPLVVSSTLLFTEDIEYGGKCTYTGKPVPQDTNIYTYTFDGWLDYPVSTEEKIDMNFVKKDMSLGPKVIAVAKTYTVNFYNGSTLLYTDHVPYNGSATYNGVSTDTLFDSQNRKGYKFDSWDKTFTFIKRDTNIYAVFVETVVSEKITDSWATVVSRVNNGTYKQYYCVGNYIDLPVSGIGTLTAQIVGVDTEYTNTTSTTTRALTFLTREGAGEAICWDDDPQAIGYANSNIRYYLRNTIRPKLPTAVRNAMKTACKSYIQYEINNSSMVQPPTRYVNDDIWALGIDDGTGYSQDGSGEWYESKWIDGSLADWRNNVNLWKYSSLVSFIGVWKRDQWWNCPYFEHQVYCDHGFFRPNVEGAAVFGFCL